MYVEFWYVNGFGYGFLVPVHDQKPDSYVFIMDLHHECLISSWPQKKCQLAIPILMSTRTLKGELRTLELLNYLMYEHD